MDSQSESSQGSSLRKSPFDDLTREELINKCKGLLGIAQKAKQAKTELQNEFENYKIKLKKSEADSKIYSDNFKTLQELVDSLTEQKLNLITEVDSAQSKIKILNEKIANLDEEINRYKADLIVKDNRITELKENLSSLDCEVISLKRQNTRLIEENEQLINQLSEIEERTTEVNNIGLQQREQLEILEQNVKKDEEYNREIANLTEKVNVLEQNITIEHVKVLEYENKIKEVTQLFEFEKSKKEKANIKLRSYKDKILKCAACINQLKNSRFILTKTVKEYSENIPKWQNDIIKASKVLEKEITELNNENARLKDIIAKFENEPNKVEVIENSANHKSYDSKLIEVNLANEDLHKKISQIKTKLEDVIKEKMKLNEDLESLKLKYDKLNDIELPSYINENKTLRDQINKEIKEKSELMDKNKELIISIEEIESKNKTLSKLLQSQSQDAIENLNLQIKALESEKAILVKEKLNARDHTLELENQNRLICEQKTKLISENETLKTQLSKLEGEKLSFEKNIKEETQGEINLLKSEIMKLEELYSMLKKEHDDILDLNGLLREEVDTLKLSLEQPKDETDNLSDLNVSLQTDIVKLETKLSAYKQENASLLVEVKESRNKLKEYDSLVSEYENTKAKLSSYKSENTELLHEMKEINQVLKERGESISKLQKAINEMERLVETLEKDRDNLNSEKSDFLLKIEELQNELQSSKKKLNDDSNMTNEIILERDQAVQNLKERDYMIESLKEELAKLKQNQQQPISVELPNDDMSTSTISKADEHARMKDLDETFEDKYTKLRLFALKLKKKYNEVQSQLEETLKEKAKLEKIINENNFLNNKLDNVPNQDTNTVTELQEKVVELSDAVKDVEAFKLELDRLKVELEKKNQNLEAEVEAHKITKEKLEKARRDIKKKNVLSLEMEDYERSMKELTAKMEENKKKMVQMESTIDTQEGTMTAMKTQIKLLEEQIKTEETQNRLLKEELQHSIEEGKDKDNVILVKNNIISQLEHSLEDEKRRNEEADLEMTSILAEKEKIIISLGEEKAELNNKVKKLEFKCAELNESLKIANIELEDLKTEYTSYKVRAQAVLRQNQTVDHSQEEQLKEETAALRAQMESLTAKLSAVQEQCAEQSAEVESAKRRAKDASNEASRANQRTARLQADLARVAQQLESERTQHKLQISTLTQCYKTQISELEAKLEKETEVLKQQLTAAQENVKSGKASVKVLDAINQNQYMIPVLPKDDNSDGEMDINVSMIPREEGEGSESAPSPPPSKPYTSGASGRSPVPLERLLEEGVPDDDTLDTSTLALTPEQEIGDLKRRLNAQLQRVKHVTMLLSESERECARMAQLSELLKVELRRVRGTTQNVHNTEYMKNVTLKFLTLPPGDERGRLVPVLQKILSLTQEESQKIQAIAKGLDPNPSKGWGSYLPWPGGK